MENLRNYKDVKLRVHYLINLLDLKENFELFLRGTTQNIISITSLEIICKFNKS
jgi:hypothetical protein